MKKFIKDLLFIIYAVVAIFVTVCLLSYNQFKISEFGDKALVIIKDNNMVPYFEKGSIVIVDKKSTVQTGDRVFFYNTYNQQIEVALSSVTKVERVTDTEKTYTLQGDRRISSEYVLGSSRDVKVIKGAGTVLNILESRWGFLFIIVLPSLLAFIYQITIVVSDIRGLSNKGKVNEEEA